MITIRQSMLGCYEVCPYMCMEQWKEYGSEPTRTDDDVNQQNKYSFTGIKFHETMEFWGINKIAKNRSNYCLSNLHNHLDAGLTSIPSKLFDNVVDEMNFRDSLHDQLDWIFEQACDNTPLMVEQNFFVENLISGMPPFTGTIDRIDGSMEHRDVDLIDYKTGKPYTKNEMKSNMQATIYCLWFYKTYGFFPKRFIFYFTKYKKTKEIEITQEFISNGVERIRNIWLHIMNRDFQVPIKPNKFYCKHFCKSDTCKHKTARWSNVGFEVFNPNQNIIV